MRKTNIELLRFIMCITVVLYHTRIDSSYVFSVFSPIIGSGVLVFGLISGYMMVDKKSPNISRLIITIFYYLFIVIALNLLLEYAFIAVVDGFESRYGKNGWLIHHGTINMWYIWALLFVYLISFGINRFLKRTNKWISLSYIFVLYLIFMFLVVYLQYYKNFSLSNIFYLTMVYMFGGWLKLHSNSLKFKNFDLLNLLAWVWLSSIMIINTLIIILVGPGKNTFFGNSNFSSVFSAISIFYLFNKLNIKDNKFLLFLGRLSIPIYFIHWSLIDLIKLFTIGITTSNEFNFLLISTIDFAVTLFISFLLLYPVEWVIKNTDILYKITLNKMKAQINAF
ncbi:acyltransferase family protein [Spiroplasma monobiae]|uniref:Acyltransferase 3 domain-containing protein n=1 Tax=Spiroplasma monobiae MQ-1 TaxID=1336748 RepID=A0A2K9LVC9_SPISQ|nr:acyltransferase [Spiroplasma monobiae]AUM63002.1 hypothetical protein SMONO_v1c07530 [Spiroplasma monobiae MQ-1]